MHENFKNYIGIYLLFNIFLYITGYIRRISGSYSPLNILNGSLMIFGGILMFIYPLVRNYGKKKNQKEITAT